MNYIEGQSEFTGRMSSEELGKRIELVEGLPVHQFFQIRITENGPGHSKIELLPSMNFINTSNSVHGGVIYSTLDTASYVAILPLMEDNQNCVTHDIQVSMLRACPMGKPVHFHGILRKVGKRIAFCDSEAWCDGELIAVGRITKSIITV